MIVLTVVFTAAIFAYLIVAGADLDKSQTDSCGSRNTPSAEGRVRVNFTSKKSKKIFKDNIGEYVDFEEIQDKD